MIRTRKIVLSMAKFTAKGFIAAAGFCLAFGLITGRPLRAQTPNPVTGTAGFETGLQKLEDGIYPPFYASSTDSTVTVNWGDGSTSPGLVQRLGAVLGVGGTYSLYGTHIYAQPGTYTIESTYQYCPPNPLNLGCPLGKGLSTAQIYTSATIYPPGKFVILSIGDSVASGEGNPNEPNNVGTNNPTWSFWDDAYSDWYGYTYPPDVINAYGGNPEFPCHRSGYAGPAQAANTLIANNPTSDITFIHYACSGAETEQGDTAANAAATVAQDAINQLKIARARLAKFGAGIDILLISAGSNDMYGSTTFGNGFGGLAKYCLENGHCDTNNTLQCEVAQSLSGAQNLGCTGGQYVSGLPTYYKNLAMEINCQQPPPFTGATGLMQDPDPGCTDPQRQIPKLVLITEYMDPTHDQNGNFPTSRFQCGPAFQKLDYEADGGDFNYFYNGVVKPLNDVVDDFPAYAQAVGLYVPTYAVRGIGGSDFDQGADDFVAHGVCAGDQRWIDSGHDSIQLLGEGPAGYPGEQDCSFTNLLALGGCGTEQLNGMLHPNSGALARTLGLSCTPNCGHEDYSGRIYATVVQDSPPMTTASATSGGQDYVSGTWTNQSVQVSLSASNAIQQAAGQPNVGTTYYAVDNAQCGSSFATQYPANVPGCTVYTGSFNISDPGKHTVTFFSTNSKGYPILGPGTDVIGIGTISCNGAPLNTYVGIPCEAPSVPPLEGVLQTVQVLIDKNPPLAIGPGEMVISPNQNATFNVTLGHVGWGGDTVNLVCSTNEPNSTCTMNPSSVALNGTGNLTARAYVVTATGTAFASPGDPSAPVGPRAPIDALSVLRALLALATGLFLAAAGWAVRRRRWARVSGLAACAILFGVLCAGCSKPTGTVYAVTVTGTSADSVHIAGSTLVVQ